MKKSFFYFMLVAAFISCTEKNTPTNPGGGENPGGDNSGDSKTITYKPKYLTLYEYWYSYIDKSGNTQVAGIKENDVSKTVYVRGEDVRYLKSTTTYLNNNLIRTISYQNSGNADFGVYTAHTATPELIGTAADTTYWYDEARSLP